MPCPECGSYNTKVMDSRPYPGGVVRRRRGCTACRFRWNTIEVRVDLVAQAPVTEALLLVPKEAG